MGKTNLINQLLKQKKPIEKRGCGWCSHRTESGSCSLTHHGNTVWDLKTLREPLYDSRLGFFYVGRNCKDFEPEVEPERIIFS
jgi:hypothetical protein